jgi:PadR family transcriptional regulator
MDVRGHLDLLLLNTVHRLGSGHGYAIIASMRQQSDGVLDLPEGTVYPALRRLEHDGLVASDWDTAAPRRRRVYRLTADGSAAMEAKRREWTRFQRGVRAIVQPRSVEGRA